MLGLSQYLQSFKINGLWNFLKKSGLYLTALRSLNANSCQKNNNNDEDYGIVARYCRAGGLGW